MTFLRRELQSRNPARRQHAAVAVEAIGPVGKALIPDLYRAAVVAGNWGEDHSSEVYPLAPGSEELWNH